MPVCKHCRAEITEEALRAAEESVCPKCGAPFEAIVLADEPVDEGDQTIGAAPDATIAFGQEVEDDSQEEIPLELDLSDEDSEDDSVDDAAEGAAEGDPLDATMAFDGSDTKSSDDDSFEIDLEVDEEEPAGAEEEGDQPPPRLDGADDPEATIASDGAATIAPGEKPGLGGPEKEGKKRIDAGDSSSGSTPDDATMQFDSSSMAGSSGQAQTPTPREITGLASADFSRRRSVDGDRGSQSLQASGAQTVGPQNVRLRSFELGGIEDSTPELGPNEPADYRFVAGPFAGGMGVVHKARQSTLDRPVAIKQIRADKSELEANRNNFVSEAVITGQLEHPNIVPVHDLGLGPDGRPFYSMKFVEGQDWEDCLRDMSEEENLGVLIHVAQAIAFAHSRNVIHMDLKPGNIRIGNFGEVQVMDFGLASRLDSGKEIKPGGTPMYMAPELALPFAERATGKKVSSKHAPPGKYSDIYLLGALLFKVITGKAPHTGKSSFDCLRNAAKNKILPVKRKTELLEIAYRAMATEPADRYETATEFIEAIKLYQAHAQSNLIAKRATRELRTAEELGAEEGAERNATYASFARSQHGFQNALDLWPGNSKAQRRLRRARRLYAETALENGDYDLSLSLLDAEIEEDQELRVEVNRRQRQRSLRETWFKTLQYATAASLVLALGFIALSVVLGRDALSARAQLETAQNELVAVVDQAKKATKESEAAREEAARQTEIAGIKTREAEAATERADAASLEAERAIADAGQAKQEATIARREADRAKDVATTESYHAAIGTVRSTLNDSGEYAAWKTLQSLPEDVKAHADRLNAREWVALQRMVDWQSEATEIARTEGPTLIASSTDRLLIASNLPQGGADCQVRDRDTGRVISRFASEKRVRHIVLSADGRWAAAASDQLRVWNAESGARIELVDPDPDSPSEALALAFHPHEPLLLVGVRGGTRLWRIEGSPAQATLLRSDGRWHGDSVTAVGFSPDGARWFSADRSGVLNVWLTGKEELGAWRYRHGDAVGGSPRITTAAMTDGGHDYRIAYGADDGGVYELMGPWASDEQEPTGSSQWIGTRPEEMPEAHFGATNDLAYADGGQLLVSVGGDTLLVHRSDDAAGGSIKSERRYHDREIISCSVARQDGEPVAFTSDAGGRVVMSRLEIIPEAATLRPADQRRAGAVAEALLDPGSGRAIASDSMGYVRVWDSTDPAKDVDRLFVGHDDHRDTRAWLVEGPEQSIVTITADRHACFWNPADGSLRRKVDLGGRFVSTMTPRGAIIAADNSAWGDQAAAVWFPSGQNEPETLWNNRPRLSALCVIDEPAQGPPTLAVGLRDGQVYLWREGAGRLDLVASSVRPHWRPIRSLKFDSERRTLYSGDNGGLVASWRVAKGLDSESGFLAERFAGEGVLRDAPVTRIEVAPGGEVLAVQQSDNHCRLVVFEDSSFDRKVSIKPSEANLLDACFDPLSGDLLALSDDSSLLKRQIDSNGWEMLADRDAVLNAGKDSRPLRLSAAHEGQLILSGAGVAQLWELVGDRAAPVSRVASRSKPLLLSPSNDGSLTSLTADSRVDNWGQPGEELDQRKLAIAGQIAATAPGPQAGQAYLSVVHEDGRCSLELWDTSTQERRGLLADRLSCVISRLASSGDQLVGACRSENATDVFTLSAEGELAEAFSAPRSAGTAVDLAVSNDGRQIAVAFSGGQTFYAQREGDTWTTSVLDRRGVTALAFTPEGDRLMVGVASGRVFALTLKPATVAGEIASRTLLSFAGHRARVTTLGFSTVEGQSQLVSGDAAGRVIARPF